MTSIPSKLLMLRTLSEVPRSEYADIRVPADMTKEKERLSFLKMLRQKPSNRPKHMSSRSKQLRFNAAVWLSVSNIAKKPVSLWLSYKDAQGENTILVDEQCLGSSLSAMLSGDVSFRVTGDLEYLRACCGGVDSEEQLIIEDVHVRRLENQDEYLNPIERLA